ncbi:MAG: hypothetical protein DWQ31_03135 [Planctomycetota bacterium]|nr:MAG: hypothetical protein DWQ31_03135 [Planctomycetota bacterium]REJ89998.1 MAG: hypothetical protein DWQ35_17425 [Planctomycetota bacterium]
MWSFSPILDRHLGSASTYLVLLLSLGLVATWFVGLKITSTSLRRRVVLSLLRIVTIALVILALLRPTRVFVDSKMLPSTVVFLADKSRSMTIEDSLGGKTRWEVLQRMFADLEPALAEIAEDVEIRAYAYDVDAVSLPLDQGRIVLPEQADGDQTDHGESLRSMLREEDGKRLIGVFIAGDGAQQTLEGNTAAAQAAARSLARQNCPLIAVSFGQLRSRRQARDVILETMPDNLSVFVKNELSVSGTVRVSGYVGQEIPVQLIVEEKPGKPTVVATTSVRAEEEEEQLRYELTYVPEEVGEFQVAVRAVPQSGELTVSNNELPTFLTVREGGIRVLYLQGEYRREQTFLRRALAKSPDIEVELRTLHTRNRDRWPVRGLTELFQPDAFDVYIIGDVDSDAFSRQDLRLLRDTVRDHQAGLIMLGGWHTFWPGGYQNTPLFGVLPLAVDRDLDDRGRQRFETFIPPDLHLEGPLRMLPTKRWGEQSFIMQIGEGGYDPNLWRQLPPLPGANFFRGAKSTGFVLAETERGEPLLIAGEPGGRVLAFAVDATWRWAMRGFVDEHRRFWRQVVLWLARHDEIVKGSTQLRLERRRFPPGAPVAFKAVAYSATGGAVADAEWKASIRLPDGTKQPLRLARRGSEMTGQFLQTEKVGEYVIEVSASRGGQVIGEAESQFLVYEKDFELSGATADPAFLASLAQKTEEVGGRVIVPEELPRVLRELAEGAEEFETEVTERITYWDRPWFFGMIVALLSLEWFLRKYWRLA